MSRVYKVLSFPSRCAVCSAPVMLARKQDRYQARKRGFAYCSRPCSDAARAANISKAKRRRKAAA